MLAEEWTDGEENEEDDGGQIDEYDITATPNDFNLLTLTSFVESGAVKIPGFQRNYVWDKARASKLIESLIIGIPVPQLFLYEEGKNKFLVIDGQQRLMTIYYFFKQRFPKKERRTDLRQIFEKHGRVPDEVLQDDKYFEKFNLYLPSISQGNKSKFSSLNYSTLGDFKTQFDLRPLRNIVIRQNSPADDDSAIYEVFNRLNTGGVNLRPQEIRTSMYHSNFYDTLYSLNSHTEWRRLLRRPQPDLHMKDIEILLRAFAFAMDGSEYTPSLVRFLNRFSKKARSFTEGRNSYLQSLFDSFLAAAVSLPSNAFVNPRNDRFNVVLFENVFYAVCKKAVQEERILNGLIDPRSVASLASDDAFIKASLEGTTRTDNVKTRFFAAEKHIQPL